MKSHLAAAHDYGVLQALKTAGYNSVEEVQKEAAALGLEPTAPPEKTASQNTLDPLFAKLKIQLGK